jgi:hypothetical protein
MQDNTVPGRTFLIDAGFGSVQPPVPSREPGIIQLFGGNDTIFGLKREKNRNILGRA